MEAESEPFIAALGLARDPAPFPAPCPLEVFSGELHGMTVHVVRNGKDPATGVDNVGTNGATLAAWLVGSELKPDLIVNAGTAGGFRRQGGEIGDVYVCSEFRNHDRRIAIPGFDRYGIGEVVCAPEPAAEQIAADLGYKVGSVTTGNSLDWVERDMEQMVANGAHVKDMEGAAIAWAAGFFQIPVLAVKAVTDIVDGDKPTHEEFLENLGSAAAALKEAVPKVLGAIAGA